MDALEKFRKDEARRLICWIRKNRTEWLSITQGITEQNVLVAREFRDVIKSLRDNGFYQLIVLLLYSHNDQIQNAFETVILSSLDSHWDENLPDKIIDLLLDQFIDKNN